ncbi:hypothetical protein GCM10010913_32500 [Paenibacillus aceti]|uniref:Uncharacterized protein n=1 Tax=Paenibacillus aceti TaxID=1820010 RepID=A0ABQ1W068_9BACL|nr:hypothetical protein GCM10010913_32500 [Paenibacillus aceti]
MSVHFSIRSEISVMVTSFWFTYLNFFRFIILKLFTPYVKIILVKLRHRTPKTVLVTELPHQLKK